MIRYRRVGMIRKVVLRRFILEPPPSLAEELTFVEAAAIHFASVANQSRYILARRTADSNAQRRFLDAETP